MQKAVTSQEMKAIEKAAADRGMPYLQMMENAGRAAAEEIIQAYRPEGKIVLTMVGKGNNGGDGLVAARLLSEAGALVIILLADGLPATEDAKTNFARCQELGIEILHYEPGVSDILFDGADLIIDALYGAGFHGALREPAASACRAANRAEVKIAALDLPSGLNADTGDAAPDAIQADLTVAFGRLKLAQTQPEGLRLCGKLILADIGI